MKAQRITSTLVIIQTSLFIVCGVPSWAQEPEADSEIAIAVEEGVPGGVMVDTTTVSARVTGIKKKTRELTLVGPQGNELTVTVGPAAVNFDQIKVGDMIKATVTQQLVIALGNDTSGLGDGSATTVALAAKGAQPGGLAAEITQVTGTVVVLDGINRTATLQFDDGSTQEFPVRKDIDLGKRRIGEQVVFQVAQSIAIDVEKQ